jgi:hypothetical protein
MQKSQAPVHGQEAVKPCLYKDTIMSYVEPQFSTLAALLSIWNESIGSKVIWKAEPVK